ncbi:MFS general substrate transporter [Hyaloscypha bicolor E]|uniref:MFS general substrate transporter n=1 Tax=Hyaloscypha bicolor E TaxID=1095630 RepID=A0A2J6T5T5_9HELO|nr:MFS general substrate transporter [Hyaloscypha bicolor E]PMD58381.1 MFS general substrate transporter [Hyaloscypha bicolor E]
MATLTAQTSLEQFQLSTLTPSSPSRSPTQTSEIAVLSTNNIASGETVIQELKPVDGGVAAWTVLITAFVFEAVLWGFPISFGVFEEYYSTIPEFKDSSSKIALIGTLAQGLSYLGAPFSASVAKRFPRYQRQQIWAGWPLCILGLVCGSFTTTVNGLIITQGIMYGVGFVTLYYPIISMVDEWWVARKGMAFGIIASAAGASGTVMPLIINALLKKYGYKTTLRAISVAMVILTGPLIFALKGRLTHSERSTMTRTNWSFVRKPLFWVYCSSTLIQGLGFFFPAVYLPSYAADIGLSSTQGALILAAMAIAQVLGQFVFGYLSDKHLPVSSLAIICSFMAMIATFGLWGVAKSLGLLLTFSIIFGFFAYGFATMRVGMGRAVSDDPSGVVATFAILVFLQGVGNVLVGPISAGLLEKTVRIDAYGINIYRSLVIFTGACMSLSAVVIVLWFLLPKKVREVQFGASPSRN